VAAVEKCADAGLVRETVSTEASAPTCEDVAIEPSPILDAGQLASAGGITPPANKGSIWVPFARPSGSNPSDEFGGVQRPK